MSVVLTFTMTGVFIGVNGTSTDLEWSVWRQVVVRRPSHMAGRPSGVASTDFSTNSSISSLCRCMGTKAWAKPPQTLAGRPTAGPTWPAVRPTWSMYQIHPRGDDNFDIWYTSHCHPLKCLNLVPKFLKSNKH
jgi:hypothetical protein